MANGVDPDQTAPIGAVCSGSTLFASILNLSVMLGNYLQQTTSADDFSRRHFQKHFFLGALRVNVLSSSEIIFLRKKELIALLQLSSCCRVAVSIVCLFLAVPWVGLWYVLVAFPGHTHLLTNIKDPYQIASSEDG